MSNQTVYPYIPNSAPDVKKEMMEFVNVKDEMELYEEIPEHLRFHGQMNLPEAIRDEYSIKRHIEGILAKNKNCQEMANFLGAGCQQHYTPAVCDEMMGRGEFATCYSADAYGDHGKYQVFFEYQTMICELTGMEFTTFPCHDGAQAAATTLSMANRMTGRKKILLPRSMNPEILAVMRNYTSSAREQNKLDLELVEYNPATGLLDLADLRQKLDGDTAAVFIENPSFFGIMESQAEEIGKLAREAGAEFIVYADPLTLGVMEAPANYGATMVTGDIHSLGLHLTSGGAHAGYITVPDDMRYIQETKELVYGLVETEQAGELGFSRTFFERTHYAIREKGKEFTGTQSNFWLFPVAAYLSLMGPKGMEEIAETNLTKARYGANKLSEIDHISLKFSAPFFNEFVVDFSAAGKTVTEINHALLQYGIFGGLDLSADFPELGQCALFCVTECNSKEEIDRLAQALKSAVEKGDYSKSM